MADICKAKDEDLQEEEESARNTEHVENADVLGRANSKSDANANA